MDMERVSKTKYAVLALDALAGLLALAAAHFAFHRHFQGHFQIALIAQGGAVAVLCLSGIILLCREAALERSLKETTLRGRWS